MSQHDQVIDNGNGLAFRTDINAAIAALFSSSSGSAEPTTKVPGQLWFDTSDTTKTVLKVRDQTNAFWLTLATSGGNVSVGGDVILNRPTVATDWRVKGQVAGKNRWSIQPGNTGAEAGSNAGSDFGICRYDDAGALIDCPITIERKTGKVTMPKPVNTLALAHRSGSGTVAITVNTWTKVNLGTIGPSVGSGWSLASNGLNVPIAGTYQVDWQMQIAAPTSICSISAGFGVNLAATGAASYQATVTNTVANNYQHTLQGSRLVNLAAGDRLDMTAFCNVAGASVSDNSGLTWLQATLMSAS